MKLPRALQLGVPGAPTVPDRSSETEWRFARLAQGFQDVSDTLRDIEIDRLDTQAQAVAHEYDVSAINLEAQEFTKQFYSADDPLLQGLETVRLTEKRVGANGELEEVPRTEIPADEVWPELLYRNKKQLLEAQAEKIESPRRRTDFYSAAEKEIELDNLRIATKTAELQYARAAEQRKFFIAQYREIGRWDKIDNLISSVRDPGEKQELEEWARETKILDSNTATIGDAVDNLDAEPLEKLHSEYLQYMSGEREYNGPFDKDQLEDEAHRIYRHIRQIRTLTNADQQVFLGEIKYNARQLLDNNRKGYIADPAEENSVYGAVKQARAIDPTDETLYNLERDLQKSSHARNIAREIITDIPPGMSFNDVLATEMKILYSNRSDLTAETRDIYDQAIAITSEFSRMLRSNPMEAIATYGLDQEFEAPIEPINWSDPQSLSDALSERQNAYTYYQGIYEFDGDILLDDERAQLNSLLSDDALSSDQLIATIATTYESMPRHFTKVWAPSIGDKKAGKFAAVGQVVSDHFQLGQPQRGMDIANTVLRGYTRWANEPTLIDDYEDLRGTIRQELASSYLEFPTVVDNYLDTSIAYMMATYRGRLPRRRDLQEAFDIVTGGTIEQGGRRFLTPSAGVTQRDFDEWLGEYSPDNIEKPVQGWGKEAIVESLREGDMQLVPTGRSRTSYYVLDKLGRPLRHTDGSQFLFNYDPNARKRFTRVRP